MLTPVTDGVWIHTGPVSFLGLRLTSNMVVLRLPDGSLLVSSPRPITPDLQAAVTALGPIAHLYAPNTFHHQWLGEWAKAFPDAKVHGPGGLRKKRPDLTLHRDPFAEPEPAFADVLDEVRITGFVLEETVLVHRPSRTLVVADVIHNVGRPEHGWTKAYTQMSGFYDRVALSRVIRWTAFPDKKAARRAIDAVMAHPFDRIVVGHGAPVTANARASLSVAYDWLPAPT